MDNLADVKSKIKFEGVDEEINQRCMSWIQRSNDCFGHRYDSADQEECGTCIVMADVDGRKEPTWVFCKELCEQKNDDEPTSPELKGAIQEIQTQKKEKKDKTGILCKGGKLEHEVKEENHKEEVAGKMAEIKEVKESKTAMVKRLLTEGKTEEEVAQAMVPLYVAEGKSEDWAKKRAKGIVKLFLKESKK
jgi:hypothetical protein